MELIDLWRGLVLAAPAIVFGLLVIWAAVSQVYWFWRIAAVLAACSLMLLTIAHQVAVLGLISGGSIVLTAMLLRSLVAWRSGGAWPWRIRLFELLLWMAVACAAAGIVGYSVNHSAPTNWRIPIVASLLYALSLIVVMPALWIATARWWVSVLLFVAFLALTVGYAVVWQWLNWWELDAFWTLSGTYWPPTATELFAIWQMGVLWLLLAACSIRQVSIAAVSRRRRSLGDEPMPLRGGKLAAVMVLAALSAPVWLTAAWLYWEFAQPAPAYPPGPSGQNNYHKLVALAKPLRNVYEAYDLDDYEKIPLDELTTLRSTHAPTLRKIERELHLPCYVVLPRSRDAFTNEVDYQLPRYVLSVYAVEGELHERGGRIDAAADAYLHALRYAETTARGGLMIDVLISNYAQTKAVQRLWSIRQGLSAEQCHRLARELEQIDARREPWSVIEQRDRAWGLRVLGWEAQLSEILDIDILEISDDGIRDGASRHVAIMRLAAAEMAIRAYWAEHGRWPTSLDDLVPQYLAVVPQDPFGGKPLRYWVRGDRYVLYSLGANRRDDGGQIVGILPPADTLDAGDILLDGFDLAEDAAAEGEEQADE